MASVGASREIVSEGTDDEALTKPAGDMPNAKARSKATASGIAAFLMLVIILVSLCHTGTGESLRSLDFRLNLPESLALGTSVSI
jgi:hypothetical protein